MASSQPTLTPLLPTKPILNKTGSHALLSPLNTTLPSPSPHFQHPASATKAVTSYFALASPSTTPVTPSILLKPKVLPEAVVSPLEGSATAGLGPSASGPSDVAVVVEEEGTRGRLATATNSGASTPQSTIVPPQRPAADAAAALLPPTDVEVVDGRALGPGSGRASRSPSPHCHFAPLPKVELGRPGTRRNSFALGVATRNKIIGPGESPEDPFNMDLELPSIAPTTSPSLSRRSSRSSSPSPPRRPGSSRSSRTQSPALSRRASTDALNLHFVEAGPARVSIRANPSSSRDRENGVLGFDAPRSKDSAQWREDHNGVGAQSTPIIVTTTVDAAGITARTAPRKMAFVEPERVDKDLSRSDETELDEEDEEEEEDDEEDGNEDEEEEEDEEEGEREKDDEDEDDEDQDGTEQLRVSARAGAIEVVHWHKDESKKEVV